MEALREVAGAPAPVGAYSAAVKANGFLFCAGQVPIDPKTGSLVSGGIEEQTRQVLKNLRAVLDAGGTSFEKVVMTSIFLSKIEDAKAVNSIYAEAVNEEAPPARQTFAVKDLPLGALVEISVIAAL